MVKDSSSPDYDKRRTVKDYTVVPESDEREGTAGSQPVANN
jgi:hypothetical protein